jgi:hypothetical protein
MLMVNRWAARAPGLSSAEDWQTWSASPEIPMGSTPLPRQLVPPAHNRKASNLSKYALEVGLEVAKDTQIDFGIFASRHGEIDHTVTLLDAIAKREILSPMAFSQSVHNAAAGLFTIILKSNMNVTSLCAGRHTFDMALVEAHTYLSLNPQHQALVVCFDQRLPDSYQADLDEISVDYSLALVLSLKKGECEAKTQSQIENWPRALNFLVQFLQSGSRRLSFSTKSGQWAPCDFKN